MYKRILPAILVAALVLCSIIVPAAASDDEDYHILDLKDYITGYRIDSAEEAWGLVNFPNELCAVHTFDMYGWVDHPREFSGNVSTPGEVGNQMQVYAYWPGIRFTNSYIAIDDLPSGSKIATEYSFLVDDRGYQTSVNVSVRLGVTYFDSNFNPIESTVTDPVSWVIDDSYIREHVNAKFTIEKHPNAVYMCYTSLIDMSVLRSNDEIVTVSYSIYKPTLLVKSNAYDIIINGLVNAQKPDGSDIITDSGNSENSIIDGTEQGRLEAEQISDSSAPFIMLYLSGFQMFGYFFSMFSEIGLFKGLLTVSLSLGMVAFLLNSVPSFSSFRSKSGGKE